MVRRKNYRLLWAPQKVLGWRKVAPARETDQEGLKSLGKELREKGSTVGPED